MNVLSLFDGMSCGFIALKKSNFNVQSYYASEIDKFAIKESKANFPGINHLGDITKWQTWSIDWSSIDLLIGGSPCQGFSTAGKGLGFSDKRSNLFFIYVDILNYLKKVNPNVKFMLENVRMKKQWLDVITKHLGVEPVFIDSKLVSAQSRKRFYWCNWHVAQPKDKGVLLKNIIEHGVVDQDKSYCIDANYWKGGNLKSYFEKHRRHLVFQPVQTSERGRRLTSDGSRRDDKKGIIVRGYEVRPDGKTCALTTVQKDNFITQDYTIRKLTIIECCRLQGVPDDYFKVSSNTQAYKMLGNGWQVDTVAHIFGALKCGK